MAERRTTGLAGLDAQLGGGVPPGTAHVLIGEPMNAFELFPYHFAAGGKSSPNGTLFLVTDRLPEDVKAGVARVGGDPNTVKVEELTGAAKIPVPPAGTRVIIDSFSTLVLRSSWDACFGQLEKLKQSVRKNGDTLLVTINSGMHEQREEVFMKSWADGVLEMGFDRQGFGLYPYLKVTKMRGAPDSSRFLLFKETEKGLFMESTKRVF